MLLYLHNVFKRSCLVHQIGAGIQVPPKSSKILEKWGSWEDVVSWAGIHPYKDGRVLSKQILDPAMQQSYDAPYLVIHKAGHLKALAKEAKELGVMMEVVRSSRALTSPRHRSFWRMARHGRLI